MKQKTYHLIRELYFPDWRSEMEAFFQTAVSEMKEFARETEFPVWTCPEPDVFELDGCYHIEAVLPENIPETLNVTIIENVVILAGLRWIAVPSEEHVRLCPYRRVVALGGRLEEGNPLVSVDRALVRIVVKKRCRSDMRVGITETVGAFSADVHSDAPRTNRLQR